MKYRIVTSMLVVCLMASFCLSAPTTDIDAVAVVAGWLIGDDTPFGTDVGRTVRDVETFYDDDGVALYHVVSLDPTGFVVVAPNDEIEPIIAFVAEGAYERTDASPLCALLTADLRARLTSLNYPDRLALLASQKRAKWDRLLARHINPASDLVAIAGCEESVSDIRVPPIIKSKWGQKYIGYHRGEDKGPACYNYYTPPGDPCDPNNYASGCTATGMAQVIRHYRRPISSSFRRDITVDGVREYRWTRGRDGQGGEYDWHHMPFDPDADTSEYERQQIGALCYDAGVAVNMNYSADGSGASLQHAARSLRDEFGFGNGIYAELSGIGLGDRFRRMVFPNLDAQHPVLLSAFRTVPWKSEKDGHTFIADGYGYDDNDTRLCHLNMGHEGVGDCWYNLPASDFAYPLFEECVYNLFPFRNPTPGQDYEIISGRITNQFGHPVIGLKLDAFRGAGGTSELHTCSATTSATGVYAFDRVIPNTNYTIIVAPEQRWLLADPETHRLDAIPGIGQSVDSFPGNLWPVDITVTMKELRLFICNQGSGYASVNGQRVSLPWEGTFPALSRVKLRAEPLEPFDVFHGWKGYDESPDREIDIIMTQTKFLYPYFREPRFFSGCGVLLSIPAGAEVPGTGLQADTGGTYWLSFSPSKSWPGFKTGDHVWIEGEIIDACGASPEIDKTILVTTIRECTQGGADFAQYEPQDAGFSPSSIQAGEVFTLLFGAANYGTVDIAANWRIRYYASLDTNITSADHFLYGTDVNPRIPAGSQKRLIEEFVFPGSVPSGQYYVGWIFDPHNAVPESNENNNAGYIKGTRLTVGGGGTCNADLCQYEPADEGFYPSSVEAGDTFILDFGVRNCGTETIPAGWRIRYYASADTTITSEDCLLFEGTAFFELEPGQQGTPREVFTFPSGVPSGQYYIGWIFDPHNSVCESNESNNAGYIKGTRLTVVGTPAPDSFQGCGQIVNRCLPLGGGLQVCRIVFQTDSGEFYRLDTLGGFDVGDRVYVEGHLDMTVYDSLQDGLITVTTITSCSAN